MVVLFILWIIATLVQIFYYIFFYSKITKSINNNLIEQEEIPVSVVICAKNESENLKKFLPSVLNQNYSNYEVVVVNDCSEDDTQYVLEEFKEKYNHLKVTQIKKDEKFSHGKKLALLVGIKSAKNNILLLTDADCKPVSDYWIKTIVSNYFKPGIEIVLGYGGFFKEKGFLNKIIRYDAYFIALQYLSFALAGIPYMGTGRNLSYKKDFFFKNKGFASFSHLLSGDDDLFINKTANKNNTAVCINNKSFTLSVPKNSFKEWLIQKKRHYSTFKYYKFKNIVLIIIEPLSRAIFYLAFLVMIFFWKGYYLLIISLFALRFIVANIVHFYATKKLNEKDLFYWFNIFDFIFIFVQLLPKIVRGVNNKWR